MLLRATLGNILGGGGSHCQEILEEMQEKGLSS